MEQQENNFEDPEKKLRSFKEEIRDVAEQEKIVGKTGHFSESSGNAIDFNVDELSVEDMDIWGKVKDDSITKQEYDQYRAPFDDVSAKDMPQTRITFLKFISNKVGIILMTKDMKEKGLL